MYYAEEGQEILDQLIEEWGLSQILAEMKDL